VISDILDRDKGASIAVLGRSRSCLHGVVGELKRAAIGYRAEELDPLIERPVTRDKTPGLFCSSTEMVCFIDLP